MRYRPLSLMMSMLLVDGASKVGLKVVSLWLDVFRGLLNNKPGRMPLGIRRWRRLELTGPRAKKSTGTTFTVMTHKECDLDLNSLELKKPALLIGSKLTD